MKVAIVGGGVGGLTAAAALSRKGIECVVYEQAPSVVVTGASLQLGPNASFGRVTLLGDAAYATLLGTLPWGTRQPIWEHDVRTALALPPARPACG